MDWFKRWLRLFGGAVALASFGLAAVPQCPNVQFSLTAVGQTTGSTDNRQAGCEYFTVAYQSTGFSAISLRFESASGATTPGTFGAYSGTIDTGVNPNTNTTGNYTTGHGYVGWYRMRLTNATGSGTVTGVLFGTATQSASSTTCPGLAISGPTWISWGVAGCVITGSQVNGGIPNAALAHSTAVTTGALKGDGAGGAVATGGGSDCVHGDGTTAACGGGGGGGLTLISSQTLMAPATTVTFSSIPGTFNNLILYYDGRCDDVVNASDDIYIQFNGDTGANYTRVFYGQSTLAPINGHSTSQAIGDVACAMAIAGATGSGTITIFNYANSIFLKNYSSRTTYTQSTLGSPSLVDAAIGSNWNNTAAITDIVIGNLGSPSSNFIAGSIFTLYGL